MSKIFKQILNKPSERLGSVELVINGQPKMYPKVADLEELHRLLELPSYGVAVELNGQVISKQHYQQTPLASGDRLEIVRLVGGG